MVLDGGSNDMLSFLLVGFRAAAQHHVIAFAAAAGKNDLFRLCIQCFCDLRARGVQSFAGFPRKQMQA